MDDSLQKALNFAYFYLKFRPRSKQEMNDYLLKKTKRFKWSPEIVEAAMSRLEEMDLVNDEKFITWYVEQKTARKAKAVFLIKRELHKFGIDKNLIDNYFGQNEVDEEVAARGAIGSRWLRWQQLDKQKRFAKAAAFLSRRGFSYDVIKKTISKLEDLI